MAFRKSVDSSLSFFVTEDWARTWSAHSIHYRRKITEDWLSKKRKVSLLNDEIGFDNTIASLTKSTTLVLNLLLFCGSRECYRGWIQSQKWRTGMPLRSSRCEAEQGGYQLQVRGFFSSQNYISSGADNCEQPLVFRPFLLVSWSFNQLISLQIMCNWEVLNCICWG